MELMKKERTKLNNPYERLTEKENTWSTRPRNTKGIENKMIQTD